LSRRAGRAKRPAIKSPGAKPRRLAVEAEPELGAPVSTQKEPLSGPVLLFDGECGLCNRLVRLLLRMDGKGRLRFSSLEGPSGQAYLIAHGLPAQDFSTIVFVPDWAARDRPDFQLRTDGVAAALRACGGCGSVLGWMIAIVPRHYSDGCYRFIARLRHRAFGPRRACPLPKPEWATRFIDC
jgi:predicted DCC family thiol-disulfide oxidoreductase YuxK